MTQPASYAPQQQARQHMPARPRVTLKPRQVEAADAITRGLNSGVTRQLVALPTGVGKTILGVSIAGNFDRTLFLVNRQELLEQTIETFGRVYPGEPVGRIHGRNTDHHSRFNVGMIQTVYARRDRIPADTFDLVIVDECHHAAAKTWRKTLDHFTPELRLGLSATPERTDGAPLSNLFDDIIYQMNIKEAVEEGYLAPPIGIQVSTEEDLDTVRTTAGDFNQGDLAATIDTPSRNNLIVNAYEEHAENRKTVVFTVSIDHAKHLAEAFVERGHNADWVSGNDPDRVSKIARYKAGEIHILTSAMLLTEGFDDPATSCAIMARPTKSKSLYIQACGRALRLHPGKENALIIDVADNTRRHRLMTVWDFWGGKKPRSARTGEAVNFISRERKVLEDVSDLFADLFDTDLELEAYHQMVNMLEAPPTMKAPRARSWHTAPPTQAQVKQLRLLGFDTDTNDYTRGQVSQLLDGAPAHPNALKRLLQYGFDVLSQEWTVGQANAALKEVSKRNLRPQPNLIQQLAGKTA